MAVNGPAIGLGASILPLCDVVWANEKAWFQTPYTTFGQSPDGCSTVMFPRIMGGASVSLIPVTSPGLLSHPMAFQPRPVLSVTPPVLPIKFSDMQSFLMHTYPHCAILITWPIVYFGIALFLTWPSWTE